MGACTGFPVLSLVLTSNLTNFIIVYVCARVFCACVGMCVRVCVGGGGGWLVHEQSGHNIQIISGSHILARLLCFLYLQFIIS